MRNKCSEKNPSDSLISTVEEQEEGEDKEEEAKRFALRRWKREIEKLRERERERWRRRDTGATRADGLNPRPLLE